MKSKYTQNKTYVTFSEALDTRNPFSHIKQEQFKRTYENKVIGGKKPIARFNRDLFLARTKGI